VPRRQLLRAGINGARLGHITEREVLVDGERVELAPEGRMRQERLQLGAEHEQAVRKLRVMKRLDPEAVAREEQGLAITVPQREREHAPEALDALLAPLLPGVNDHLGIALRAEDVAQGRELGDQRLVVVDLAVEDHHDAAVLVVERLLSGGEVDDRKPPVTEPEARLQVHAALVGTAVKLRLVHSQDELARDRSRALEIHHPDDSAHGRPLRGATALLPCRRAVAGSEK
jgi:hypothetical protein